MNNTNDAYAWRKREIATHESSNTYFYATEYRKRSTRSRKYSGKHSAARIHVKAEAHVSRTRSSVITKMRVRAYGSRHVPGRGAATGFDDGGRVEGEGRGERKAGRKESRERNRYAPGGKYPTRKSRRLEYQANGPCNSVLYDRVHRARGRQWEARRAAGEGAKSLAKSR